MAEFDEPNSSLLPYFARGLQPLFETREINYKNILKQISRFLMSVLRCVFAILTLISKIQFFFMGVVKEG